MFHETSPYIEPISQDSSYAIHVCLYTFYRETNSLYVCQNCCNDVEMAEFCDIAYYTVTADSYPCSVSFACGWTPCRGRNGAGYGQLHGLRPAERRATRSRPCTEDGQTDRQSDGRIIKRLLRWVLRTTRINKYERYYGPGKVCATVATAELTSGRAVASCYSCCVHSLPDLC